MRRVIASMDANQSPGNYKLIKEGCYTDLMPVSFTSQVICLSVVRGKRQNSKLQTNHRVEAGFLISYLSGVEAEPHTPYSTLIMGWGQTYRRMAGEILISDWLQGGDTIFYFQYKI